MRKILETGLLGVSLSIMTLVPASAADIKLVSSVGVQSAIEAILPDFRRESGHNVKGVFGTAANMKSRIDDGEAFDLAILTPAQIDDLVAKGKASQRLDLARAAAGLALRASAPKPDISSDEKLKTFLLGAKSIAHSDPALGGFSVTYFYKVASGLGIADALKPKLVRVAPGDGAGPVAKGEAELGIGLSSEIAPVAGVQFMALRPGDPESYIRFAAGLSSAGDSKAARALVTFLQSPAAKEVFKAKGLLTP
jgi:molybdate transport system substrate-binding protein